MNSVLQIFKKKGLLEDDIIEINSILEACGFDENNDDDNNNKVNKQSLIKELKTYRNIKLAIKDHKLQKEQLVSKISEFGKSKIKFTI